MLEKLVYGIQQHGDLMWFGHVGWEDGSFQWEGPKKVGTGWGELTHVFSGGAGIIYGVTPIVEATVHVDGRMTPASGGELKWFRHVGREDGSFQWEGPKKVGTGWGELTHVFSGGSGTVTEGVNNNFCGTPDPNRDGSIHPLTFGSPHGRWSRTSLSFSINPAGCKGLTSAKVAATITQAFRLWSAVAPFLTLQPAMTNGDIQAAFGGADVDKNFGTPGGTIGVGMPPEQGRLFFDSIEDWTEASLLIVAVHEIGHVLGLSHSNTRASIMYPYKLSQWTQQANAGTLAVDAESVDALWLMYGWSPQKITLTDRGTTDRPALAFMSVSNFAETQSSLHMVWTGGSGDSGIYWSQLNGDVWMPQANIPGIGSSHSPSLTSVPVAGDTPRQGLFMAWKGAGDDQTLYWSRNDGRDWLSQSRVEGVSSSCRPAVAQFNGQVYMAWKGAADDSGIYWSTFDGAHWAPQRNVLGVGTSDTPALVALDNQLHMFWKGAPGDTNAYHSTIDNGEGAIWKPQQRIFYVEALVDGMVPLATGTSSAPSACVRGNRIMLAWKGAPGDSGIYFSLFDGQEFTGQIRMSNVATSVGPTVVDFSGQTHMLWKGAEGDSNIYWSRL